VKINNLDTYTIIGVMKSRRKRWVVHVPHTGREEVRAWFLCGNLKERDHLDHLGVDVRIILKWMSNRLEDVDRIDQAEDRGRWRAFANTVMNLRMLLSVANFLTS
jgi:hypothetical protein